jgi:hypothetical protein
LTTRPAKPAAPGFEEEQCAIVSVQRAAPTDAAAIMESLLFER